MTLLAVGPFGATSVGAAGPSGASNEVGNSVMDVVDSSTMVSRATVSGLVPLAIVNVVVDAGVINRAGGDSFCRRCALRTAADMYRGTNKMDRRDMFAIVKDKAFMTEKLLRGRGNRARETN